MSLFNRLFGKPGPREVDTISTGWTVLGNTMSRTFNYSGLLDGGDTSLQVQMRCEFLKGEPILLLTFHFEPMLAATEGYLTARCWSRKGETPYFLVHLKQDQEEQETVVQFTGEGADKMMLERFSDGESLMFWLGGPSGELLNMPIPFAPGLSESMLNDAWTHAATFSRDLSTF